MNEPDIRARIEDLLRGRELTAEEALDAMSLLAVRARKISPSTNDLRAREAQLQYAREVLHESARDALAHDAFEDAESVHWRTEVLGGELRVIAGVKLPARNSDGWRALSRFDEAYTAYLRVLGIEREHAMEQDDA